MLKIFSCSNEEIYFDRLLKEMNAAEAKAASAASSLYNSGGSNSTTTMYNTVYEKYCYNGVHMTQVIYMSIVLILYYSYVAFFHYFLTLSYPHEKLPWACLPTKVPILREFLKFFIVFSYQETNLSQKGLNYINIVFTVFWFGVVY